MDKTIAALMQKRAKAVEDLTALAEKMGADDYVEVKTDQDGYDALKAEIEGYDEKIKRMETATKLAADRSAPVDTNKANDGIPARPVRYSQLKAFKGPNAEKDAYRSGMFIKATMFRDQNAMQWCRDHGVEIGKAQAEGTNTAGGFLVIPEFSQTIIDLREEVGVFRREVRVVPMGSDSLSIPRRDSGVTAYFVGENAQITESQKGWGQVTLTAKKIGALSRFSTELAEDAIINIADDLASEMAYAFAALEDQCGWNGDGTSAYGNIVGVRTRIIDGTHTASVVDAASGHDLFSEIDATDLMNVMGKLPQYALRNAKWYISQAASALIFGRLMAAAGGNNMETLAASRRPTFMGYPIVIDQTLPAAPATAYNGVPILFFGDLRLAATMGERRGVRIKTSDDRYFEYDQIGIQATERVDIVVHDLGTTTAAGPLIALNGKT